jgi:hypothetical protein
MSDPYEPTQAELDAMVLDAKLYPDETEEQTARRIFREGLPNAAKAIVDIAENSTSDRTRLTAAQYIVERNLGKVGDDAAHAPDNALAKLVNEFAEGLKKTGQ